MGHARNRTIAMGTTVAMVSAVLVALPVLGTTPPQREGPVSADPAVTDDGLAAAGFDGLTYAHPADGLDLVTPPELPAGGAAALEHPITVPPGRAGMEPELALEYDSGADNGWLGLGWDLSVGDISVDTRWGVPRYSGTYETETYVLDGAQLTPTAVTDDLQTRRAPGADGAVFHRRVDDSFETIRRHGVGPGSYWWTVRDKSGTTRYYGAAINDLGVATRDAGAILETVAGAGARWALTAVVDVSNNITRYSYDKRIVNLATGQPASAQSIDNTVTGSQLYLEDITYTGSLAPGISVAQAAPAYRISFGRSPRYSYKVHRAANAGPGADVTIDASAGAIEYTDQLLTSITVTHRSTPVRSYTLRYGTGAFGKTILVGVDQRGSDGAVAASHTFGWHDDVRSDPVGAPSAYAGFASVSTVTMPGSPTQVPLFTTPDDLSALGATDTLGGDGRAYIGFNPTHPSKTGSGGINFAVDGGRSEDLVEFIDLNGDGLPDKVFRSDRASSTIRYQLNRSVPGTTLAGERFGPARTVANLEAMGSETSFGFAIGPELHVGVSLALAFAGNVSIANDYFEDVNADGLPDFVYGGRVLFNRLDNQGRPTFQSTSSGTPVPIGGDPASIQYDVSELQQELERQSPMVDTVRRWVAPHKGRIAIDMFYRVLEACEIDASCPNPELPDGDGVRLAVQKGATELWAASASPSEEVDTVELGTGLLDPIHVEKGDVLYFRVGAIYDGTADRVSWRQTITYLDTPTDDAGWLDANRLSPDIFDSQNEFSPYGRASSVVVPLAGDLRVSGTLTKPRTTDDLYLVLRKFADGASTPVELHRWHIGNQLEYTDGNPFTFNRVVQVDAMDRLWVRLEIDSPIDLSQVVLKPSVNYVLGVDKDGKEVVGEHIAAGDPNAALTVPVPPDADVYARSHPRSGEGSSDDGRPVQGWVPPATNTYRVEASVTSAFPLTPFDEGRQATIVIKRRPKGTSELARPVGGLTNPAIPAYHDSREYRTVTLQACQPPRCNGTAIGHTYFDLPLHADYEYWFEWSSRDPGFSPFIQANVSVRPYAVPVEGPAFYHSDVPLIDVEETFHVTVFEGIFPAGFRGWSYAGYDATGRKTAPLDESAFTIDQEDPGAGYPQDRDEFPESFDDEGYESTADPQAIPYAALETDDGSFAWRGPKAKLAGAKMFASPGRLGIDNPNLAELLSSHSGGGAAVTAGPRVGLTMPAMSLAANLGPFGGSFAFAPSWSVADYLDVNGDGFPDLVTPAETTYTGPRGNFIEADGEAIALIRQDLTFGVSGGFGGDALDISGDSSGQTAGARNQGSSTKSGANVGGSFGVSGQFTNPIGSSTVCPDPERPCIDDADWSSGLNALPSGSGPGTRMETDLADLNGDGLVDRVHSLTNGGIEVELGLGYAFADPIRWSSDEGFHEGETFAASIGGSLGANIGNREWSFGVDYGEAISVATTSWVDVDGDGIVDRLTRPGSTVANGRVQVAFGTGHGLLPPIDYGDLPQAEFELTGHGTGQHASFGRTRTFGAGADFTIPIGPLCLPAPLCYLIINPGAHIEHSVATTQIELTDVDGDGAPDAIRSTDSQTLDVHKNTRGRTNLLKTVVTPLGGTISLDYGLAGATVEQPGAAWVLREVRVNDGRPGDGVDEQVTTYEHLAGRFDPLEREFLGYAAVIAREHDENGGVVRTAVHELGNSTVFDAQTPTRESMYEGDVTTSVDGLNVTVTGQRVKSADTTWSLRQGTDASAASNVGGMVGTERLGAHVARVVTESRNRWFGPSGGVQQETKTTWAYDARGNVVEQVDHAELELAGSADVDLTTRFTYSNCPSGLDIAATVTYLSSDDEVLAYRDGRGSGPTALCPNGAIAQVDEWIDGGPTDGPADDTFARTDVSFDAFGNTSGLTFPATHGGVRPTYTYVRDADQNAQVVSVTDPHGLVTSVTLHAPTGNVASRTDANGNTTTYTYDAMGRLASVATPIEAAASTVTYAYHPTAPDPYATATHHDAFNEDDPIRTIRFTDGLGREVQTKHDATIHQGIGLAPQDMLIVSGASSFDALGRVTHEWFPITEPLGTFTTYNEGAASEPPTVTTWDVQDRPTSVRQPNGTVTTTVYGFEVDDASQARLFTATQTDAAGRWQRAFIDVGDAVRRIDEGAAGTGPLKTTRYAFDPLGNLESVTEVTDLVDNEGHVSEHAYDGLGRRTSTSTPDGGLVTFTYDAYGNLLSRQTPELLAGGTSVDYLYDVDRLVRIDAPGLDAIEFTYGATGAPHNAAGRVAATLDGVHERSFRYDEMGRVASETFTLGWRTGDEWDGWWTPRPGEDDDDDDPLPAVTTEFSFDSYGRPWTVTYPDGEVVTYDYDRGGLLSAIHGTLDGVDYTYLETREYDQFLDRRLDVTGAGTATTRRFDDLTGWLRDQVTVLPDGLELQDLSWEYDLVGNVTDEVNDVPLGIPGPDDDDVEDWYQDRPGRSSTAYSYDGLHRLAAAQGSLQLKPDRWLQFDTSHAFDAHSNITGRSQAVWEQHDDHQHPRDDESYDLGPQQYRTEQPHQVEAVRDRRYHHDLDGRLTGWTQDDDDDQGLPRHDDERFVTWDALDRLVAIGEKHDEREVTYRYDAAGNIVTVQDDDDLTAIIANPWFSSEGSERGWNTIWADGERFASRAIVDEKYDRVPYPHAEKSKYHPGVLYHHTDLRGSITAVSDDLGRRVRRTEYRPSGEIWLDEALYDDLPLYGFAGGRFDEQHGLWKFGARWYDPTEQMFYSPDPLLAASPDDVIDDPGLLPAYSYAGGNPVSYVDVTGLAPTPPGHLRTTSLRANRIKIAVARALVPLYVANRAFRNALRDDAAWKIRRLGLDTWSTKQKTQDRADKVKAFADAIEPKPLISFEFDKRTKKLEAVKLSATLGKRLKIDAAKVKSKVKAKLASLKRKRARP